MAKTDEQRGPIGAWLVSERKARGWNSAAVARAALERQRVMHVAPSVYAEWEAGTKRPNAAQMETLTRFYGTAPVVEAMSGSDVAAAIREQTAAIREQTAVQSQLVTLMRLLLPAERQAEALALLGQAWAAQELAGTPQPHPDPQDPTPAR